jgi:hypothetical protein
MALKRSWATALKTSTLPPPKDQAGVCTCGENRLFRLRIQHGEMKRVCLRCGEEVEV